MNDHELYKDYSEYDVYDDEGCFYYDKFRRGNGIPDAEDDGDVDDETRAKEAEAYRLLNEATAKRFEVDMKDCPF